MRRYFGFIAALAVAFALVALIPSSSDARGVKLADASRHVETRKVVTVVTRDRSRLTTVTLNNGAVWKLSPCRHGEARRGTSCYWDAKTRGDKRGRSFANIRGHAVYVKNGARIAHVHETVPGDSHVHPNPTHGSGDTF